MNNSYNNKHLNVMRSFRFSPLMAHQISISARSKSLSESELVRQIIGEALSPLFF